MNDIQRFFQKYSELLKQEVRNELARPRRHSPGYDRNAYGQGRNPQYGGDFAISDRGNLWQSVNTRVVNNGYGMELEIADYYIYQDQGVRPQPQYLEGNGTGSSNFLTALTQWAASKGFSNPASAAFAIRRNIWKFGIAPTNFMGDALDNITLMIEDEFGDAADKWIDELLEGFGMEGEQE